jgi:aspartate/methionine/tyrosine aminotransferase
VRFPLADYIDDHVGVRHNLGRSGMKGTVRHPVATSRAARASVAEELVAGLAKRLRVEPERVFLTHGASEANAWATVYLARHARGDRPRARIRFPEYPPLWGMAEWAGLRVGEFEGRVALGVLSQPRNPEGFTWSTRTFDEWAEGARSVLIDETFREFTTDRSRSTLGDPRIWTTGTFTKAYAGDDIRVGWVVCPPAETRDFARFHGLSTDEIAPMSVATALRTLGARERILRTARSVFERNRRALAAARPDARSIRGPTYFDRAEDGDALARRCLRASVLVCPGRFFGAPRGVRLCLTQRSFPEDLTAYLRVVDRAGRPTRRPSQR